MREEMSKEKRYGVYRVGIGEKVERYRVGI